MISLQSLATAAGKPSHELGAWFEAQVQAVFKDWQESRRFSFMRLYDSKAAGNYLPTQAGDFIAACPRDAFLVETKASAKHTSLASCLSANVSKEQALGHFLWNRAQRPSLFIFCGVSDNVLEIWDGGQVGEYRRKGLRLKRQNALLTSEAVDLESTLRRIFFL